MTPWTLLKLSLGFVALGLGTAGLFLPVWPTTPFALLALGCFSSMPQMQKRILKIRFFRQYYESYYEKKQLPGKTLSTSLAFLWSMLCASALLTHKLWVTGLLFFIGCAVTAHPLWLFRNRQTDPSVGGAKNEQ